MEPPERLDWNRPPALPGAEILYVGNSARAWHVYHDRYTACACERADAGWRYRGRSLLYGHQTLGLMEPGETHVNTYVRKPMDFKVLLIAPDVFRDAAEEEGIHGEPHFRLAVPDDPRLFTAIERLAASVEAAGSPLEQQTWLTLCIHRMLCGLERRPGAMPPAAGPHGDRAVLQAMACLRDRFDEPVDLEALAALTGYSKFSLVHAFSSRLAMPPHAYQIHVRIERARALLEAGVPPIRAALAAGFADQSHFNRHFKEIMKVTPGLYQKQAQACPSWRRPWLRTQVPGLV